MTTITIKSNRSETRHLKLVADACQTCRRIGMVLCYEPEGWRVCIECSRRFLAYEIVSFPVPPEALTFTNPKHSPWSTWPKPHHPYAP